MADGFYGLPNQAFKDEHFWVDWVELLCVANIDEAIDRAAVSKRARSYKTDLGQAANASDDDLGASAAEEADKWVARVEGWFGHLEMREKRLKDAYPFTLSHNLNRLCLRSNLSPLQKLYLVLLMASALRFFPKNESDLTASFELISLEALRKLLPQGAEAYLFGANKLKAGKYDEDLWTNLQALASDFLTKLNIQKEDIAERDRGDNGADLIGWFKIESDVPGMLSIFGQCACTKNWEMKQMTSSADRWSSTMSFQTSPQNSVFIPFCLRKRNAGWHSPQDLTRSTLVIDRFRFLNLLKSDADLAALTPLPAFTAVESLLKTKEAVV